MQLFYSPVFIYLLLFLISSIICNISRNRFLKFLLSSLLSIFLTFELVSYWSLGEWIGYEFLSNFHYNLIKGFLFDFKKEISFFLLITILQTFFLFKDSFFLKKTNIQIKVAIFFICLTFLSLQNNPFAKLLYVYEVSFSKTKDYKQYLPSDFVEKPLIYAEKGKNIIFISVESLENNFLNKDYGAFTPNLNMLKNEYFYYPMEQDGAGWTSGSLYTLLTSIPAIYPTTDNGNYWFQNIKNFKIPTLGFILEKAGYKKIYAMANPEYSGTSDLLKSNFFNVISEKNHSGQFKTTHDLDLFNEVKQQIAELSKTKEPYALFLSTIDTHWPKGNYDSNMEKFLKKKKDEFDNPLNFSIQSVDYLIGNLIEYLKSIDELENTVFFIVPDHTMMGSGKVINLLKKIDEKRDLFLISNEKIKSKTVSQTKLPRIIIDAANIKTNVKFVADYENYNFQNAALNKSITQKSNWEDGFSVKFLHDKLVIKSNNEILYESKINNSLTSINFIFNNQFSPIYIKKNTVRKENFKPWSTPGVSSFQLIISLKNNEIDKYYLGNYWDVGFFKNVKDNKFTVSKRDIELSTKNGIIFQTPTVIKEQSGSDFMTILSSTWSASKDGYSSQFIINGVPQGNFNRGVNLIYMNNKKELEVRNFDTWANKENLINLINKIELLNKNNQKFILVSDDAIRSDWDNNEEYKIKLKANNLPILSSLNGRYAYIAYSNGNSIKPKEWSDKYALSLSVNTIFTGLKIEQKKETYEYRIKDIRNENKVLDIRRFIAHAGGEINGETYTNSLEALNYSYKNGIKLFELDIIETTDGHFVAAHDWENWKRRVNYPIVDNKPVSLDEFMSYKIKNKYTPLDMQRINDWFKEHQDAFLVTDKINYPKKFSKFFIDKNRLMMELFSVSAIEEGINEGILEVIPSGGSWNEIKNNRFILNNINFIAFGRKTSKEVIREIKNKNLKIYAFHLNHEKYATEIWSICNEIDLFYGFYVDKTEFIKEPIICFE
jgi:glycerophosphoryl diester phosphodiesterase